MYVPIIGIRRLSGWLGRDRSDKKPVRGSAIKSLAAQQLTRKREVGGRGHVIRYLEWCVLDSIIHSFDHGHNTSQRVCVLCSHSTRQ